MSKSITRSLTIALAVCLAPGGSTMAQEPEALSSVPAEAATHRHRVAAEIGVDQNQVSLHLEISPPPPPEATVEVRRMDRRDPTSSSGELFSGDPVQLGDIATMHGMLLQVSLVEEGERRMLDTLYVRADRIGQNDDGKTKKNFFRSPDGEVIFMIDDQTLCDAWIVTVAGGAPPLPLPEGVVVKRGPFKVWAFGEGSNELTSYIIARTEVQKGLESALLILKDGGEAWEERPLQAGGSRQPVPVSDLRNFVVISKKTSEE